MRVDRSNHVRCLIYRDGTRRWCKGGMLHRDNGPAATGPNDCFAWYRNGQLHREDGPAVFWSKDVYFWYLDGILQR